jgi:hypothetical protein
MKTPQKILIALVSISILAVASVAGAAPRKGRDATITDTTTHSASATRGASGTRFGLGISTTALLYTGGAGPGFSTGSLTGMIEVEGLNLIQINFTIPAVSPFSMEMDALYKRTVSGDQNTGLHVGGGFGFGMASAPLGGTTANFGIMGIGGFHFGVGSSNQVQVHVDGGFQFGFVPAVNFGILAQSPILGLSIVYFL